MPEVQRSVGRYEVQEVIGRGGAAIVYLAIQRDLRRQVALKELAAHHVADPDFAQRFVDESRVAGAMSHPSIVTVHEFFEHEGTPYMAMEYLARGSLRPYMGRLSVAQVVGVLESVLAGLSHGEAHEVVHRDLKPENLLVASDGRVKIADFGVARAYNAAATRAVVTAAGTTIGTPAYMAPEQALGTRLTPATDLYSLGIIAWEMLTGDTPFDTSDTPVAVLYRQVHEPLKPIREIDPDVDERLAAWLERMLAKRPEDRFQTAEAAWDELEDVAIDLLGPRWRREARLGAEPLQAPTHPLTPAPFTSGSPDELVTPTLDDAPAPPADPPAPPADPPAPAADPPAPPPDAPPADAPPPEAPPADVPAGRDTIIRPGRRHRAPAAAEAPGAPAGPGRRRLLAGAAVVAAVAAGAGVAVGLATIPTARAPRRQTVTTTPATAIADARLHAVLNTLASAQSAGLHRLDTSRSPARQAAAARQVAAAYARAATAAAAIPHAPPGFQRTLAQLAGSYRSLAAAATAHQPARYRGISRRIASQQAALRSLTGTL